MNTVFVNEDELYALVTKIRTSLPEDVKAAGRITRDADHIVSDAKEQAAQITDQARAEGAKVVEDAKVEAAQLVDSSEIKRLATAQAKEIIVASEDEARITKAGADEYAKEVLDDLEGFVNRVLNTIQRGRDKLGFKGAAVSEGENE